MQSSELAGEIYPDQRVGAKIWSEVLTLDFSLDLATPTPPPKILTSHRELKL